ncbi:thermonuclease family protein [Corynebacterium propinquum]|uniref:Thermonuclease family protein n=1 Tax=Corynebacterium propinquum TaxID=43769 RepID=A0AAP4BWM3_9CORY|nr:thermonuclease family protein [Corynebacterium propinquum]MDK4327108.1 thermonuclease family protein [Corynebacterium propinquum]
MASLVYGGYQLLDDDAQDANHTSDDTQMATVDHVIDGDTIRVSKPGEQETTRVRLLNIDTPEIGKKCYAEQAQHFLEELIPEGTRVRLEYDQEPTDHYGRELAGVYVDDTLVNKEVAAAGLAVPIVVEPNDRFYREIQEAVASAKREQRGVYAPDSGCSFADYKTRN